MIINDKWTQPEVGRQKGMVERWGAEPSLKGPAAIQLQLLHGVVVDLVWPNFSDFQYNLKIWISG